MLSFPNTIRSEITSTYDLERELTKGEHTLKFSHKTGTSVIDSVLVRKSEERASVYFEKDDDRENSYLAVAPDDGYELIAQRIGKRVLMERIAFISAAVAAIVTTIIIFTFKGKKDR